MQFYFIYLLGSLGHNGEVYCRNVCSVVLLDLSSAFDAVDRQILLQIMNRRLAVEGRAMDRCQSYLCQRSQTFYINGQLSGPYFVDCSVSQGSLGSTRSSKVQWIYGRPGGLDQQPTIQPSLICR